MTVRRLIASGIPLVLLVGWTPPAWAEGPGPSLVTVSGHRLLVQKRQPGGSLGPTEPYVVRGVDWAPASSSTTGDDTARRAEFLNWAAIDAPLLQSLNINTVRLYLDPGLDAGGLAVLDTLWAHGIMVILSVDGSRNDLTRVQQAVSFYKDHPAILLWLLGSEWNINLYYGKAECNTPLKAAQCTQTAAQLVKSLDTNHPVATSYGEIDINANGLRLADTQNYVNNVATGVDVWGLNVFRSDNFGTLFDQWRSISTKPMFLGEFGTDAMIHPADLPDETMQAGWDLCLWNHAITELSAIQPVLSGLGGLAFEWNDEWWKVPPAGTQNIGGFTNANGHPDGFANEDWFGLVDVNRNLRHAAAALGDGFESTYHRPPRGLIFGVGSRGTNANQYAGQYGYARFYQCGRAFYNKGNGSVGGRGFNAVVLDPVTGAQLQAPQRFDTWGSRSDCLQNNPSAAMYALVNYLNSAPAGSLVMLSVADDAGLNHDLSCTQFSSSCFAAGFAALEALGSTRIRSYCFRDSWAMIALKGQGLLAEGLSANNLVSLQTALPDPGSFSLGLQKTGTGTGSVTSDPAGLTCGDSCGSSTTSFPTGALVALTPTAAAGSVFTGWSGDPDCANGVITADMDKTCTARFELLEALIVAKGGSGSGTVTSTPPGINCGGDCAESYAFNTLITLTAAPDSNSRFAGWSGSCTGTGSCVVTMNATQSVTAIFNQIVMLTVQRTGLGSGQVTSSPTGISCGSDCSEIYDLGTQVTLTATPDAGSRFVAWSICNDTGPCTFTLTTSRHVTASFQQVFTLSINKTGSGSGTVTSTPTGIDCGTDCGEIYDSGTSVTLFAAPASGSRFTGWSGACSGTGTCVISINVNKAVNTTFVQTYTLTASRSGSGNGTVTSSPTGINCGVDCSEVYDSGTVVTLTAAPTAGSRFSGWSDACTGTGSCVVTMDIAKSATATFIQTYSLTINKSGSGFGTSVTLTPSANAGSQFTGWSGDCSGMGPCTVTMSGTRSVTATFMAGPFNLDFYTVEPCRVLDTRAGVGAMTSGSTLVFPVAGRCGIPSDARAVSLNVTAVAPTGPGDITLSPSDVPLPSPGNLNFTTGNTRANNSLLLLSSDSGSLAARAQVGGNGKVDLVVDVNGYFR
jgi:Interleukin-like EMT inducer/Divergent InlB B-repeat domain